MVNLVCSLPSTNLFQDETQICNLQLPICNPSPKHLVPQLPATIAPLKRDLALPLPPSFSEAKRRKRRGPDVPDLTSPSISVVMRDAIHEFSSYGRSRLYRLACL